MNISILLSCVLLGGGVAIQETTTDSDIVETTETLLPDIARTTVKEAFDDDTEGTTINTEEPHDAESDDCESHI